jgi:two-component sensor histidine kinase
MAVNVLVVAEDTETLRAILVDAGYAIIAAGSGADALRALAQHELAVVLLDVTLPDMDGLALAELVRTKEPTKHVPILFVADAAADMELVTRGYLVGAADFLVKPLVPAIVRAKVAMFAEMYRQRVQIESSLREKSVLLREIHHRVKNNLQIISSLLNLQASRQSSDVRMLFVETNARVRSIALVHEQLHRSDDFSAIDIYSYLKALTSGLLQTYGTLRTDVRVDGAASALTIDTAIPCGLIVNELVSNALKYAFPNERSGKIAVSLNEESDCMTLQVCDDGIGIPDTVDIARAPTMGLQLVRSLAQQLGGTIDLERDHGTRVRIRFPRPRAMS